MHAAEPEQFGVPTCNDVILESLQWNIPEDGQFYFRFIRLDSKELKDVHYVTYKTPWNRT